MFEKEQGARIGYLILLDMVQGDRPGLGAFWRSGGGVG